MNANTTLRVRMPSSLRSQLANLAAEAGVTSSHLVRSAIRVLRIAGPTRVLAVLDEVEMVRRDLHSIGNNLNQIARRLNGGSAYDPDEVRRVLADVSAAADAAGRALRPR
jgi:hypothetical protein